MSKISFVIPCLNEEKNVARFYQKLESLCLEDFEVIFVNDGSIDKTAEAIEKISNEAVHPVKSINFTRNFGKECAIRAGLDITVGDAVITLDGDLEHPIETIPQMIELWQNNPDVMVVNAVKVVRQKESFFKRIAARIYYYLFGKLTGLELANQSDFKLLDRKVVKEFLELKENNSFYRGLIKWMGFPSIDVKFEVSTNNDSSTNWSFVDLFKYAKKTIISFSVIPLKMISYIGFFLFCFSVVLSVDTIYKKLSGSSAEGFPTVILLQLGLGSLMVFCLGIIAEYLVVIYEEIKGRPQFVIKSSEHKKTADDESSD